MLRVGVIMYQTSFSKGQELVAQRMVRELRSQGYEAFLITSIYHDWEPAISSELVAKKGGYAHLYDESLGIPLIRVSSDKTEWPPRRIAFRDFVNVLSQLVNELKLNVLITHSTLWNGPEEVAKFIDWGRRLIVAGSPQPPLLFCHMSHYQEPSDERYTLDERSFREAWNRVSLTQILKEADMVLAVTPDEQRLMVELGASKEKCFLFPGGVQLDLGGEHAPKSDFRSRHEIPGSARIVAYLGTIEERKNVLKVIETAEVLSKMKDVHFVIAGKSEGEYGKSVEEAAAKLANVSMLGTISEEDKSLLLKESYLNITLSRSEALGVSQLEFMNAGVPVISSGVGGQSWLVRNNRTGIVLEGADDVEGAAKAISQLVGNRSMRDRLGARARSFASQYSITALVHGLSKRLLGQIRGQAEDQRVKVNMKSEEKLLEALVSKGTRVAATTSRLIVSYAKGGKNAISIPYTEITRIRRHSRAPWSAFLVGLVATIALLASRIANLRVDSLLAEDLQGLVGRFGLSLPPTLGKYSVLLGPVLVSSLIFLLRISRGYLVLYGASKKLFLPEVFVKALKQADRVTPNNIFAEGGEADTVTPSADNTT